MHDAGTEERAAALPEDRVGATVIEVENEARDLGACCAELVDDATLVAEFRDAGDQREQDVVGLPTVADHGMAEHAGPAVLVVGWDVKPLGDARDRVQDGAGARVLNQALVAGYDTVGARGVEAAAHVASARMCERGRGLVAVAHGLVHAADVLDGRAVSGGHVSK